VLPSRSHLQGWNPASLSPAASALSDAGHSVYTAAAGGDMLGGWTFGYVGGIIGNIVCR
jgi:hypothetical protein